MTSFLAPYRGESIAGAKTVAVTAEPRLGRDFPHKLAWRKRPRRLEDRAGAARRAATAGPARPGDPGEYEVVWDDAPEPPAEGGVCPDNCPRCDRRLSFTAIRDD